MSGMDRIDNPNVAQVFDNYPEPMRKKMLRLRQIVFEAAAETEGVAAVEETLKWGEPSYLTKGGQHDQNGLEAEVTAPVRAVLQLQHFVG